MLNVITLEEFRALKAVSFSRLSTLASSPKAYKQGLEEVLTSSGLSFGSMVDTKLTQGDAEFNKKFYVMTARKPDSEMMQKFIDVLLKTHDSVQAHAQSGYKITLEALNKKFETEGKPYYDAIIAAKDREVIDFETLTKVNKTVMDLQNNPYTKKYFSTSEQGIEILYQVPLTWIFKGSNLPSEFAPLEIAAKTLIDIVRIDHNNKTIKPLDLKTGADGFMKSYWKYKYYLQGSIIYDALVHTVTPESGYRVLRPSFIYADSNGFYSPTIYNMTEDDLFVGRNGYIPTVYNPSADEYQGCSCGNHRKENKVSERYKYKGYRRLASELMWHQKNDKWDYPYEIYQSDGEVEIDSFIVKF
jgi:hypothetical protein